MINRDPKQRQRNFDVCSFIPVRFTCPCRLNSELWLRTSAGRQQQGSKASHKPERQARKGQMEEMETGPCYTCQTGLLSCCSQRRRGLHSPEGSEPGSNSEASAPAWLHHPDQGYRAGTGSRHAAWDEGERRNPNTSKGGEKRSKALSAAVDPTSPHPLTPAESHQYFPPCSRGSCSILRPQP